jgi:hypothetical protein
VTKRIPERDGEEIKSTIVQRRGNRNHWSTVEERIQMISPLLAQPTHGLVSHLGRTHQVSRQTVSRWAAMGRQALGEALGKPTVSVTQRSSLPILVLSLVIETHARYRGIHASLRSVHGITLSVGKIAGIVKEAGQRAQNWVEQQQSATPRTLALDEQDSSQRGKA